MSTDNNFDVVHNSSSDSLVFMLITISVPFVFDWISMQIREIMKNKYKLMVSNKDGISFTLEPMVDSK